MDPVPGEIATSHFVCKVPVLGQQVLLWKLVTHSYQVSQTGLPWCRTQWVSSCFWDNDGDRQEISPWGLVLGSSAREAQNDLGGPQIVSTMI